MRWTKQQNNAINARNCSIIVSAAAGSGKTAVLTERLASMIADSESGVRADRIIAVTFTNDAASELKKRLDLKLRQLISDNPTDKHLLRQQNLLQSAHISTINAFCFELLRENITEQGVTSGFSVLDDADNNIIKAQAMDDLINYYSKNKYDKISFLYDKFCLTDDKMLAEVISTVDKYLSSVAMRSKWIEDVSAELNKPFSESVYYKKCLASAIDKLKKSLALATDCCDMIDDIFPCDSRLQEKSHIQTDSDKQLIEYALNIFQSGRIPDSSEIMYCTSFEKLVRATKKDEFDTALREIYKAKRTAMITMVKEAVDVFSGAEEDFLECGSVFSVLAEFLQKYDELIWEKKCAKNALSFDDGERLVLEMLTDYDDSGMIVPSETAIRISEYYDIIMIDEYQDSNNKQDMIFKLISKGCIIKDNREILYGNNVSLVGDVKQSIYKFRLANPQNFIHTLENSVPYVSEDEEASNKSIILNKNFRSSTGVINFVNFLFSQIMSEQCGDINYTEDEMLYFGAEAEYGSVLPENTFTHIAFIDTDSAEEEAADNDGNCIISCTENAEASYTAEKISGMINNHYPVMLKNGGSRPCQASDFCILLRKNALTKAYVDELKARGINAKGEEEKGYLKSREISILIDVLRVIDNPLLDVPLSAIILSPMYMFDIEELAYIKSLDWDKPLFTILTALSEGKYSKCSDIFLIERCREFLESIEKFRLYAVTMTVGELIDKIYDTTDFISVMQLSTDGDKKRANLKALIQYAKSYEESVSFEGTGGLSGFIHYIDRIIANGNDLTQGKISVSSGNYVKVQTIHKSKGLEYPFIFLAETNVRFRFDSPQAVCSDDGRIGFIVYDPELVHRHKTTSYRQICEENKYDIIGEEMRLLYVALTRAKQQLFINLKADEKRLKRAAKLLESYYIDNCIISETAKRALSFSDWIWISMFEHESFSKIAKELNLTNESHELPAVSFNTPQFSYEIVSGNPFVEQSEAETDTSDTKADNAIVDKLKRIISMEYDMSLSHLPAKMSVTQITKKFKGEEDLFDFKLKRPRFISQDNELTGSERGTAIHTFFQYCNFSFAKKNPEKEISRMCELGYISTPQSESISIENIDAFFNSELYRRIRNSDKVWREKKFMVSVSELEIDSEVMALFKKSDGMIKGIVDLLFEENGKLIIVDYKSDRGASSEKLKERYKIQLMLYKSAIELTMGTPVSELYLYSFELKKSIKIML